MALRSSWTTPDCAIDYRVPLHPTTACLGKWTQCGDRASTWGIARFHVAMIAVLTTELSDVLAFHRPSRPNRATVIRDLYSETWLWIRLPRTLLWPYHVIPFLSLSISKHGVPQFVAFTGILSTLRRSRSRWFSSSSSSTRDSRVSIAGEISSSVQRGVMCCGQLTSQAST